MATTNRSPKPWTPARIIRRVLMLGLLGFGIWAVAPYFIDRRVDEAFPTGAVAQPTGAVAQPTAMVAQPTAMVAQPAAVVAQPTAVVAQPTAVVAQPTAVVAQPTAVVAQPTTAPSEPVALGTGSFTTIDALHGAEGSATIYRLADGALVLRLEGFNAQNGPDLYVGLSGHVMPRNNSEVYDSGYLELARLKANQGNQNYELPADFDLSQFKSVVIYCKAFSVVFSSAALS